MNTIFNININTNISINNIGGVPMVAVSFLLIVGCIILMLTSNVFKFEWCHSLQIYAGISILILITLNIVNTWRTIVNTGSFTEVPKKTFPPDSYSFVALYSPKTNADAFCFGLIVFLFQLILFLLMILSVIYPEWRTIGEVDDPASKLDGTDISDWVGGFILAKVTPIVRATQIIALISCVLFPDASLMEISTAIEMFPRWSERNQHEKVWYIVFSYILRGIQGFISIIAVFLLIMTSSDVTQIILNFTAVSGNRHTSGNNENYSNNLLPFSEPLMFWATIGKLHFIIEWHGF